MDYFAEIADHPDVPEALAGLLADAGYPHHLNPDTDYGQRLSTSHPTMWRAELLNWFHLHPPFAAAVWRALGSCTRERARLVNAIRGASWLEAHRVNPTLARLGLHAAGPDTDLARACATASHQQLEAVRQAVGVEYAGPEFIEKLIESAGQTRSVEGIAALIADPATVRELARTHRVPVPFAMVHADELDQVVAYRQRSGRPTDEPPTRPADDAGSRGSGGGAPVPAATPLRRALEKNLLGLSFSGGGIRSATFNLGVLQALAKLDVLRQCDYLSTVSGGGYIGTWFAAWTRRECSEADQTSPSPAKETQDRMRLRLSPARSPYPLDLRIRPIRYLREFSNYLTPQTGFFSADTWTLVSIYARNLVLNLLVLIPLIAAVLLVPRLVSAVTRWLFDYAPTWRPFGVAAWPVFGIVGLGLLVPMAVLILNVQRSTRPARPEDRSDGPARPPWYAQQGWIQFGVVVPFLVVACLVMALFWRALHGSVGGQSATIATYAWWAGAAFFAYLVLIHAFGCFHRCWPGRWGKALWSIGFATLGGAATAWGLFWLLGKLLVSFDSLTDGYWLGYWLALTLGPPLVLLIYSLVVAIQLGLLGTEFPDEQREWWSRLRAWTLIYSLAWSALFAMAILVPYWILGWRTTSGFGALGAWIASTVAGIRAARSAPAAEPGTPATPNAPAVKRPPSLGERAQRLVLLVAPYVFIVGLFALVAVAVQALLFWDTAPWTFSFQGIATYRPGALLVITTALTVLSFFVSWRIGINEFSMHHFYKNRLVRCYLGASRWQSRKADWFTGFDANDDLPLSHFDHQVPGRPPYPGPYPIVNTTLNLVAGKDLAWQERKATSFVFTPKYCGYDVDRAVLQKHKNGSWPDAYMPTLSYVRQDRGPTLGMAMAISGAAASPNMGRVTSPASAFLMTLFNVRLGWWLPNPRKGPIGWDRSGPALGISYTAVELFGMTDDERTFVNLSDGGHFENLGVYELIRRGCRYIIASDAGQDGAFGLEDLGNLVRKCRTDFGVEIEIGTDAIRDRSVKGWSTTHCVVGKIHYLNVPRHDAQGRVVYVDGQPCHEEGLLIYMKPTITGDEPFDVLEYYRRVPEFPHESTADQWFNESQFESYRRLGLHIAETTFQRFRQQPDAPITDRAKLFADLQSFWHPPNPKVAERSTDHALEYSRIMELLRSNTTLGPLDSVLFDEIPSPWTPGGRDEFYVCNALIQLIENVYADLDLEQNYDHPDVAGWMRVFRQWVARPAFARAWEISQRTYAPRFQNFYRDRLAPPDPGPRSNTGSGRRPVE